MRVLAVDLGERRTGLAVGDRVTGVISPVATLSIAPGEALLAALAQAVQEHDPDAVVVGLPLNMDGTEGPQAKRARALGDRLAVLIEPPLHYQDERLTSFAAEQKLAGTGRSRGRKKAVRDALAAAEILGDFFRRG